MTKKQSKVHRYLIDNHSVNNPCYGPTMKDIIFSKDTIEKYSFARNGKPIIDSMTFSYLGKMVSKKLIKRSFSSRGFFNGYYAIKL